jgi:uncharacterized protein
MTEMNHNFVSTSTITASNAAVIVEKYPQNLWGLHGVAHWARVLENGRFLGPQFGADLRVVELFAVLHDCQRMNDQCDDGHGQRAADFALSLRGSVLTLSDEAFDLLYLACQKHTDAGHSDDPTVAVCWDADRLDLGRVGIAPDPQRLNTWIGRRLDTIEWAFRRSQQLEAPRLVMDEWHLSPSSGLV